VGEGEKGRRGEWEMGRRGDGEKERKGEEETKGLRERSDEKRLRVKDSPPWRGQGWVSSF
jgi:hypothetical protein